METDTILEEKSAKEMKIRAQKLALIEKLRSMGFSEKEIEYNFSQSTTGQKIKPLFKTAFK